ncbi:MAG TPA: hypothetical protein VHV54_20520, partial [Candidatus Binatia bacterium]|nr:hypothetical protein [Candidatus Binatia bacterium]
MAKIGSGASALCLFTVAMLLAGVVLAQPTTKVASPPAAALLLSDVATEAESVTATLREIQSDLPFDRSTDTIAQQLPALAKEIDDRLRESRKIIVQSPSIEMLRSLEGEWQRLRRELSELNRALTRRINDLEGYIVQLDQLAKIWDGTFAAAKEANAPAEILDRIQNVSIEVRQRRADVDKQRARSLTMQNRVGVQDARIADVLRAVDQARENLVARLLRRDGAPIWSPAFLSGGAQQLQEESRSSFSSQWTALSGYAERHGFRLGLGILIFIGLAVGLFWTRRVARGLSAEESDSAFKASVFETPISTALLLALFASRWINPQAPRLLWVILGAVALIPSVIIVDRIIGANLRSLPYVLIAFFFIDLLRTLAAAVPFLPRLLFLVEMLCAILVSLWLVGFR